MDVSRVRLDAPHVRPDCRRVDRAGAAPHRGGRRIVVLVRGAPHRASLEERANPGRLVDGATVLEERAPGEARRRGGGLAGAAWPARRDQAGDTGYEVGEATLAVSSGTAVVKFVVVWKKEDDQWRLHRDIWTPTGA